MSIQNAAELEEAMREPTPPASRTPIPGAFAYDVHDVAQLVRRSVRAVQMATTAGDLPAHYAGTNARYTPEDVRAWVESWPRDKPRGD